MSGAQIPKRAPARSQLRSVFIERHGISHVRAALHLLHLLAGVDVPNIGLRPKAARRQTLSVGTETRKHAASFRVDAAVRNVDVGELFTAADFPNTHHIVIRNRNQAAIAAELYECEIFLR